MCGIVAILAPDGGVVGKGVLEGLRHRGPDGGGVFQLDRLFPGHGTPRDS